MAGSGILCCPSSSLASLRVNGIKEFSKQESAK